LDDASRCVIEAMRAYGRDLTVYDERFLQKTLDKRLGHTGVRDADEYGRVLRENKTEADALSDALGITYSCFFREPFSFALIEKLLPGIIGQKVPVGELRVWSAGCASGQEAYSIAMLLQEALAAKEGRVRYRIFATDISREAILAADAGLYRPESLSDVRFGHVEKYFLQYGGIYRVSPLIRNNIIFSVYDLLDQTSLHPSESIFGGFDIVFCRNVLLYYREDVRRSLIKKLAKSLTGGGYLVIGEAEKPFAALAADLKQVFPSAAVFVKKTGPDLKARY